MLLGPTSSTTRGATAFSVLTFELPDLCPFVFLCKTNFDAFSKSVTFHRVP